jgi:hypothetical protein
LTAISSKFIELASVPFGEPHVRELLDRLWQFDEIGDLRELVSGLAAT